jgi:hypothetical protein
MSQSSSINASSCTQPILSSNNVLQAAGLREKGEGKHLLSLTSASFVTFHSPLPLRQHTIKCEVTASRIWNWTEERMRGMLSSVSDPTHALQACRVWTPKMVKSSRLDVGPDWRFAISSTATNLPKPVKDLIVQAAYNFLTIATSYRYQTMMAMMLIRSRNISILAQAAIIACV